MSSCFGYQKRSPFWEPVLVPCAHIICFQITIGEGTMFGHNFGNHFWSPFWEPILLLRCAKFGGVGDIAAHISTPRPCRHDEQTTNASRRAKSNTTARAYPTAWRAALFDLARRDAFVVSVPKTFEKFC